MYLKIHLKNDTYIHAVVQIKSIKKSSVIVEQRIEYIFFMVITNIQYIHS